MEVREDGRSRTDNKRVAFKELEKLVIGYYEGMAALKKKEERDFKIHNTERIRTYDFKAQKVKDHRSKKTAPLKKFLDGKVNFKEFSEE